MLRAFLIVACTVLLVTTNNTFQGSQPSISFILSDLSGVRKQLTLEFFQQSLYLARLMGVTPDELASAGSDGSDVSFLEAVEAFSQVPDVDAMRKILSGVQRMMEAVNPFEYDRYFFGESDR